jgi:hypothetical protein
LIRAVTAVVLLAAACQRERSAPPLPVASASPIPSAAGLAVDDSLTGPTAFLTWAAEARSKPHAYGPTEECHGADSPRHGICARTHFPDRVTSWDIDYVKRNPRALKFHAHFGTTLTSCGALGSTLVREWRYASMVKALCKFDSGPLAELYVVLQSPGPQSAFSPGTDLFLFSGEYLNASTDWRSVVMNQGL